MSEVPKTPYQSLEQLKNRAFNSLYRYAQSTRDIVVHNWLSADRKERALVLAGFIKKDLSEFRIRHDNLGIDFDKIPGKVRQHPHHPEMLKIGGRYISFIDDLEATVGARVREMVELVTYDIDEMNENVKKQAQS